MEGVGRCGGNAERGGGRCAGVRGSVLKGEGEREQMLGGECGKVWGREGRCVGSVGWSGGGEEKCG